MVSKAPDKVLLLRGGYLRFGGRLPIPMVSNKVVLPFARGNACRDQTPKLCVKPWRKSPEFLHQNMVLDFQIKDFC